MHHAIDSLATTLRSHGYTREALGRETSVVSRVQLVELQPVAREIQTEGDEPLTMLAHLFRAGGAVERERVERTLPALDVDGLADAELIALDEGRVRPLVRVDELDGLLLACDHDTKLPAFVMGLSPSTLVTVAHTPREPVAVALDVGTGSGVHALLAARHAERVVATDISARALRLTGVNARLNGVANVETREGSFLEPVEGERFGLIVANPPYIVSPDTSFLYRDSTMEGDSLSRKLLTDLPGLLEPGGFAVLQGNWIHGPDEKWWRPIDRALEGSGCDALMAKLQTDTALEYAARWSEWHHQGDQDGYRATLRRWLAHYEQLGAERVTAAMVVLRNSGGTLRRAVSLARLPSAATGEAVAPLFGAGERLAAGAVLDMPLRAAEGLTVERYERGAQGKSMVVLDSDSAFGVRRPVEPELADLVQSLDGGRTAREAGADDSLAAGLAALVKLGYVLPA